MPLNPLVTERLILHTNALHNGSLLDALTVHRTAVAGPYGDAVGPLALRASSVEEFRPLADPEGVVSVSLTADQGLLGLQEARHAIQDDTWIELDHVSIALPAGFEPADSTRALLDELAFTVPAYVEVPRTGYERALDVLAEDGVEHASYRCGGDDTDVVPTAGEVAAFVHGCVVRRLGFLVPAGLEHALHEGANGASERHGLLNVLAAVSAARGGARTDELVDVLVTKDLGTLVAAIEATPPRALRESFHGAGSDQVDATIRSLTETGVL